MVVADSQLSLAIGKNGQNVRLAAKLTGWKIDIISSTEYEKQKLERDMEIKAALAEEAAQITEEPVENSKESAVISKMEIMENPAVVQTEAEQGPSSKDAASQ